MMDGGWSRSTRRRRLALAAMATLGGLAVVSTWASGPAHTAPTIIDTHFQPLGLPASLPLMAQGISTDGRYVGFYDNGVTGRYDRQTGTYISTPLLSGLSGNGRYTVVDQLRRDLETGVSYDPHVLPAPCCSWERISADGDAYVIGYQNGGQTSGAVVGVSDQSFTAFAGTGLSISSNGRFATYQPPGGGTRMLDRTTGQSQTLADGLWWLSADARYQGGFVPGTTMLQWRDGATDTLVNLHDRFPMMAASYQVRGFSDDGQRLLYVGFDQRTYLVDLVGNEVLTLSGPGDYASAFLSGDGHHVTYADGDGYIHVVTVGDSTPVTPPPPTTPPTTPPVTPPAVPTFGELVPDRLLDTRNGETDTVPNLGAGALVPLVVTGRPDVPSGAAAVALNVTVTNAGGSGFVTVWPCDAERPTASNLNYVAGQTVANSVVSAVAADGRVCLYTHGAVDLVVDITGWFPASAAITPLVPRRVADTRNGETDTVPNKHAGDVLTVNVGAGGVPPSAGGVVLNVTVTNPTAPGFVTVWPCGVERPTASNVNFVAGQTVANDVVSAVGTGGTVCIYTHSDADVVVDVSGWLAAHGGFGALVPTRLVDTRNRETDSVPILEAGSTVRVDVSGKTVVPASAAGVVLNVTVTNPTSAGYVTVWACDAERPTASNLNVVAGATAANSVLVAPAADGALCVYTQAAADIVVDIAGWFA